MSIYMKVDGMTGDVTSDGHQNWIEINSLHYGITRSVETHSGSTQTRIKSQTYVGEMVIHKTADSSSVAIMQAAASNKVIPNIIIESCHSDKSSATHSRYKLTNVIISEYVDAQDQLSGLPREAIKLNFTKIEKTFIPRGADNTAKSSLTGGYDIQTASLV